MEAVRTEVGVDWISMTIPNDKHPVAEWYNECLGIIDRIADEGNEARERTLLGYAGISVGNCFVGVGESTTYCQLSGSYAQRFWRDIYRAEGHYSRLDVQCTAFFDGASARVGVHTLAVARRAAVGKGKKPKWTVSRIDDNSKGFSMYIGSKDSDQYLNLYNKEVESKDERYKGAWRYELRLKNDYATYAAQALFLHHNTANQIILHNVRDWLGKKGITAPWSCDDTDTCLYTATKGKTDKDTALWWLEKQVKPALDKARKLGYYEEAIKALGILEHSFEIVSRETGEIHSNGVLTQP